MTKNDFKVGDVVYFRDFKYTCKVVKEGIVAEIKGDFYILKSSVTYHKFHNSEKRGDRLFLTPEEAFNAED